MHLGCAQRVPSHFLRPSTCSVDPPRVVEDMGAGRLLRLAPRWGHALSRCRRGCDTYWQSLAVYFVTRFQPVHPGGVPLRARIYAQDLLSVAARGCPPLSSDIGHAKFGRIFLVTSKPTLLPPTRNMRSTSFRCVTCRTLFQCHRRNLVRRWDQLLWMDAVKLASSFYKRPHLDKALTRHKTVAKLLFNIAKHLPLTV